MLLASTNAQERGKDSMDIKILPLWSGVVVAATLKVLYHGSVRISWDDEYR